VLESAKSMTAMKENIFQQTTEQPINKEIKPNEKVIPLTTNFSRESVKNDKDYIYLFTDNARRTSGKNNVDINSWYAKKYQTSKHIIAYPGMTQAVVRGLDNAFPITTMVDDNRTQWKDSQFDEYKKIIDDEIETIKQAQSKFKGIKFAAQNPFGQGKISNMKQSAPKIWNYLNTKLSEIGIDNRGETPKVINQPTEIKPNIDSSKKIEDLKRGDIINFQQQEFVIERIRNEGIDVRDINTGDVDFISTEDYINETQEQPIVEENVTNNQNTQNSNYYEDNMEQPIMDELEGLSYHLNETQDLHPRDKFKHNGNLQETLAKLEVVKEKNKNNSYYLKTIDFLIDITQRIIELSNQNTQEQEVQNLKILNSLEFKDFVSKELEKNPESSIEQLLEYYKKCK
jgi:hypothetical protein